MGYTHYWTPARAQLPLELPTAFVIHVREVLALARTRVRLVDDVSAACIQVNGVEPDDFENFLFVLDGRWAFCKTAAKPYDLAVTALLALAAHHGLASVSSDGEPDDWADGVALAREATGLSVECPIVPRAQR